MTKDLLIILFAAPVAAVVLSFALRSSWLSEYATVIAAVIDLAISVPLLIHVLSGPVVLAHNYIQVDPLGAWVILCISIVYTLSSIYAIGYMRLLDEDERFPLFYGLFSGFAFTMLAACIVNNVGVWIAIELTTLISTFLVGFEREAESTEAAWKYIVVVSGGISLALLGTVLFYWGGSFVLGPSYAMTWAALHEAAPSVYPPLLLVSFLLVPVGYGTKAGLAPMHTWLPDAHSESPAPSLCNALWSAPQCIDARNRAVSECGSRNIDQWFRAFCRGWLWNLLLFHCVALHRAANRNQALDGLFERRAHRRAGTGVGFGGVFGVAGALYHMLNHSLNKSLMFFGAGERHARLRNQGHLQAFATCWSLPVSGTLWLLGAVGIRGSAPIRVLSERVHDPACWDRSTLPVGGGRSS